MVTFKNNAAFTRCVTHINDQHVNTAHNLDIVINMCHLIEYSDNYSESSGSLWQYKRQEQNLNAAGDIDNVNANDTLPFKYKSSLLKGLTTRNVAVMLILALLMHIDYF